MDEMQETPEIEDTAEDTQQVSQPKQAQETAETEETLPPEQQRGYIARLKEKNEKLEKRFEELEKELKASSGKSDEAKAEYQKELQAIKDEYARDKVTAKLENELLKSGCIDTQALMAHVKLDDVQLEGGKLEGVDLEELKSNYPYLFRSQTVVSSAQSKAKADDDFQKLMEKNFGL